MNIQYGVGFGVILSSIFVKDSHYLINLTIPLDQSLTFALVVLYYFVDWFTLNTARDNYSFNDWHIFFGSISLWCLSGTVVLIGGEIEWNYLLLSSYFIFTGFFDIFGYYGVYYNISLNKAMIWMYLAGAKLLLGGILCLQTLPRILGMTVPDLDSQAAVIVLFITVGKIGRYFIIRARAAVNKN